MLIKIDPILSPELLFTLRTMGHGDKLVLADANFPANSMNKNVIRLDGVNIKDAAKAILSVFPLDSFIVSQGGTAANRMEVDDNPNELTEAHKEFIQAVKDISGESWKVGSIERQSFYTEAKKSYAIVTTTDARPFGCFILTKGVIKPDGSVWVLEK
ncbi:ribose ABC transporter [Candidatus Pelagibacter sp.]|jgi:L-fucose mutarotase|nr:ribose ABC transporter [Candidatus Pelagibacter sp.]MDB9935821.1 ribose ABC transporter [Candidatus Pelagibacter sp.]MDB9979315.1 ribose ABC transporter [Candidatus Pelagibacter sp.]MDC3280185.1 ribose ABC transporter [bacterium]